MQKNEIVYENANIAPHSSSFFNLDANIVCLIVLTTTTLLSFVPILGYFSFLIAVYMYVQEAKSQFVIDTSMQAVGFGLVTMACTTCINIIGSIFFNGAYNMQTPGAAPLVIARMIIYLTIFAMLVLYSYKVIKYKTIEIPLAGKIGFALSPIMNKIAEKIHKQS